MKFPYGISDFRSIITEGYFYCDRTDKIPLLENTKFQLFIRPRRFGKSLVLSMLENYYDVAKRDEFKNIFGDLKIGKNPTDLRNSYFILKFDFSCVDPTGSAEDVKQALYDHINDYIKAKKTSPLSVKWIDWFGDFCRNFEYCLFFCNRFPGLLRG